MPCVLLAVRTTLKPDINASPADLVYGEGLSVPGSVLPSTPPSDAEANQQRQTTLGELRLEVARLQPTQTSAHRRPRLHIPEELSTASHVFVRRGGVQPALTTPYSGPYRVLAREPNTFKISIPGRGVELVNLERLKPACVASDDDDNAEPPSPPSPRRPGRPPGIRTRIPEPTTRRTRGRPPVVADARASRSGSSAVDSRLAEATPEVTHTLTDDHLPSQNSRSAPFDSHVRVEPESLSPPRLVDETPPSFDSHEGPSNADAPLEPEEPSSTQGGVERVRGTSSTRTFSNYGRPGPNHFSYRRPRPNLNAIKSLLQRHLDI